MFTKEQIAAQCRISGPDVKLLPSGIYGAHLLWGISGNESSFGEDCKARHEPAYDVGGIYGDGVVMKPLLAKWGSAAACSYGPWQIMFCNVPAGWSPEDMDELPKAAHATVLFLNHLLARWKPPTLAAIGECWNAGHPMETPPPVVAQYVEKLARNYSTPMP